MPLTGRSMASVWRMELPPWKIRIAKRIDDRLDYGEERIITVGLGLRGVLYVVSMELETDCIRIISVRRAEPYEIERYDLG
jgi:uncharacterized DUF497 family protein